MSEDRERPQMRLVDAVRDERERCAALVRAKKPPDPRVWWLADLLERLAKEIENG